MADTPPAQARKRVFEWLPLLAVLLVALIVRGGLLLAMPEGLSKDTDEYRLLAETLILHGKYALPAYRSAKTDGPHDDPGHRIRPPLDPWAVTPTAYRPPLYPLLLSRIAGRREVTAPRIAVLHLALGLATTWLTYHVGGLWGLGRQRVTAALLVACDPILLNQSAQIMTETLAAFLAIVGLYTMTRMTKSLAPFHVAVAGGAAGLAVLCRPTFLVWLVMVAAFSWFIGCSWRQRLVNGAVFLLGSCLVLLPWAVRNHYAIGRPIVTTTHGGYTLLLANNGFFYRHVKQERPTDVWDAQELSDDLRMVYLLTDRLIENSKDENPLHMEVVRDRFYYEMSFKCMRADPLMYSRSCLLRIWRLWSILPYRTDPAETTTRRLMRYAVAAWYSVVFVLAITGCCVLGRRLWRSPWLWGMLLCLSFTAVHTFFWTDLRMRAPLMPFVALAAAAGLARLTAGKGRRKTLIQSDLCPVDDSPGQIADGGYRCNPAKIAESEKPGC